MQKNLIIHVIDSLKRGGAETLLRNTIRILPEFDHLVIYFQNYPDDIKAEFPTTTRFIHLTHRGWKDLLKTVKELRRIIKREDAYIIHSHLFLSSFIARLATPEKYFLVNTIHSVYSLDAFSKNKKSLLAEKATLKKRHSLIAVSRFVLDDYLSHVFFSGKRFVLYNFLPDNFFLKKKIASQHSTLKGIAVGNLKEAKNYPYLLAIMGRLKHLKISLDIYGTGDLEKDLLSTIESKQLNVSVHRPTNSIPGIFSDYDFFIQSSAHEGFGLAVIEAMAGGLPVVVSDIPVLREVTSDNAHFFPLDDEEKAAQVLTEICSNRELLHKHVKKAYDFSVNHFNEAEYKKNLLEIYNEITARKKN